MKPQFGDTQGDDVPTLPTVSLRFEHQHAALSLQQLKDAADGDKHRDKVKVVRTWVDLVPAAFNASMNVASTSLPSHKPRNKYAEVVLQSKFASGGGGLTFGLSKAQCEQNRADGIDSAQRAHLIHLAG